MSMVVLEKLTPERRRQQTREHLLAAATQVFAALGFHGATLDQVARAAGFTKGAVYSNFKSKDDLFLALIEHHLDQSMKALRATLDASDVPPEGRLADFVALLRQQFTDSPESWQELYQEVCTYATRNKRARRALMALDEATAKTIAELIEIGRQRMDVELPEPPLQVARVILALDRGIASTRALDPDAVDEAFLQTVMSLLARALGVPNDQL